jgi:hypothetical protein
MAKHPAEITGCQAKKIPRGTRLDHKMYGTALLFTQFCVVFGHLSSKNRDLGHFP